MKFNINNIEIEYENFIHMINELLLNDKCYDYPFNTNEINMLVTIRLININLDEKGFYITKAKEFDEVYKKINIFLRKCKLKNILQ